MPTPVEILAQHLKNDGLDAYFAHSPVTIGYLTGYFEGAGERFMVFAVGNDGRSRLVCPALSVNQATRAGIGDVRPLKDGQSPDAEVAALVADFGLTGTVAVDDEMPAGLLLLLQKLMPAVTFVPGYPVASRLMRGKRSDELAHLHKTGGIADEAGRAVIAQLQSGMTEEQVAVMLSDEMAKRGGRPSFGIVASGANGAEPHHHTDSTVIEAGDVLIMDFGCTVNGYFSDITRTVSMGPASNKVQDVYRTVYQAHMAARKAIRPGVLSGEVDAAARDVIESAGYGEFFTHRTGHGLGLKIHEEPYIMPGGQVELMVGDCFSIEPGIYLPGEFGVRIENIVTVTADGHASFNEDPPADIVEV